MTVNELIQTACEDMSLDSDAVGGDLAASCVGLLNRAIAMLNGDSYVVSNMREYEASSTGRIEIRKKEPGEDIGGIDAEAPQNIQGVSRKVGIRWLPLRPSNPQDMNALRTFSLPQFYSYQVDTEIAPSGKTRNVGVISFNGSAPIFAKIFAIEPLPEYKLGDRIYLSDLYHDLILYALEVRIAKKYKLTSYLAQAEQDLADAKDAFDRNTVANRPLTNTALSSRGYMDDYYDGLGGVGL